MQIQLLQKHEHQRLREVRLRSLQDAPDAFGSTYEENLSRSPESWSDMLNTLPTFVAVSNDQDLGMARGAHDHDDPNSAWLISMWVDPKARGKKAGEALVQAVIDWARSEGKAELLLDVADENPHAIHLYDRMGFKPNGKSGSLPAPREHIKEHQRSLCLVKK